MQPTGEHELVRTFLIRELNFEIRRFNLAYSIPAQALIKSVDQKSGYFPDVLVLNIPNLINEPLWKKSSTVTQAPSIPLVVEVVSTNWRDDYFLKFAEYVRVASRKACGIATLRAKPLVEKRRNWDFRILDC
jgi:Uma2 family endonuclease